VLEMRGVTKTFGPVRANDGVSITLGRGEILGLLGENGAGKSTLMKILYGLYSPDEGEVFVDGERAEIRDPKDAVSRGIGMVHQHFTLIPPLTVAENIVLGAEPRRGGSLDMARAIRETEELAERYGLVQVGIAGLDPAVEPSPARLRDVVEVVEGRDVRTVFFEVSTGPGLTRALADDLGLRTGVLDDNDRSFEFATRAEHVFVRGRESTEASRQDELTQRYRTLPGSAYRP